MRSIAADLHVHSALSPCADDSMTPRDIVIAAIAADLDLIAICDHNSAENTAAVQEAAQDYAGDLFGVIAGMEITTAEEAHLLGLFPDAETALCASREVAANLPPLIPSIRGYGRQCIMNAAGDVLRESTTMLSWACTLTLNQAVEMIHRYEGIAIAAHIDRPSFSITSQLGFIPEDVVLDALEISAAGMKQQRDKDFAEKHLPLITASDAHFLDNIGEARILLHMEAPVFSELKLALQHTDGRGLCHA
jgi:PHP family Zn ribbon phosphoesterase